MSLGCRPSPESKEETNDCVMIYVGRFVSVELYVSITEYGRNLVHARGHTVLAAGMGEGRVGRGVEWDGHETGGGKRGGG